MFRFLMVISASSLGVLVLGASAVSVAGFKVAYPLLVVALLMALIPSLIFWGPIKRHMWIAEDYLTVVKASFAPEPYTAFGASVIAPLFMKVEALKAGLNVDTSLKLLTDNPGPLGSGQQ